MNQMVFEGNHMVVPPINPTVRKSGHLKKLKTMKRKYFIAWSSCATRHARLDYYDTENKFRISSGNPKRSIDLSTCFSINRKIDTKYNNVFCVYTKNESLAMVADNEEELESWLEILQELHEEGFDIQGAPRPVYEHIWEATIQNRCLAQQKNMFGTYRICLSDNSVSLVKVGEEVPSAQYPLSGIRRCGHSTTQFFMEVGRCTTTGEGEIWMTVDDPLKARSMHDVVLAAMKSLSSSASRMTVMHQDSMRTRTGSMGTTGSSSPRRQRSVKICEKPRPLTMYTTVRHEKPFSPCPIYRQSTQTGDIATDLVSSSSHNRSSSSDSRVSSSTDVPTVSPLTPEKNVPATGANDDPDYFNMIPSHSSRSSSIASHPSSRGSRDRLDSRGSGKDGSLKEPIAYTDSYMDMAPTDYTAMMPQSLSMDIPNMYMDMSPGQASGTASSSLDSSGYLSMEPTSKHPPIGGPSIRNPSDTGYFDMAIGSDLTHNFHERAGYFTMRATGFHRHNLGYDYSQLKPDRVVSYLSDDATTADIHKRTYSVGSRPTNPASLGYERSTHGKPQKTLESNKSTSVPILKTKAPFITNGASPTTLSCSFKSDDSESFMEIGFYRSRTSSDSHGSRSRTGSDGLSSRPRTSSFTQNQMRYPHRPRSSSHANKVISPLHE